MSSAGSDSVPLKPSDDVVKFAYMKKLKTMKKKFFVLRAECNESMASLEYYDSAKKWKNGLPPKRRIPLKTCFNINRRTDTKHKYVIALFTKGECFSIVLDTEKDLEDWLQLLLIHQQGHDTLDGGPPPKPYFEQVWRVVIQRKELTGRSNLTGNYLLCLTDCTLSLIKPILDDELEPQVYEFPLQSIRRCGHLDAYFYMELGQASCVGSGNIWFQVEDTNIAQNMHSVIMNACTNCPKKETHKTRSRSSSTNESSRPVTFYRPSHAQDDSSNFHSRSNGHHDPTASTSAMSYTSNVMPVNHDPNIIQNGIMSSITPTRRFSTGTRHLLTTVQSCARTNPPPVCSARQRCDSLPGRANPSGRLQSLYQKNAVLSNLQNHNGSLSGGCTTSDSSLSMDDDNGENWLDRDLVPPDPKRFFQVDLFPQENEDGYTEWKRSESSSNNFHFPFFGRRNSQGNNGQHYQYPLQGLRQGSHQRSRQSSQSSHSPPSEVHLDNNSRYIPASPEPRRVNGNRSLESIRCEAPGREQVVDGYVSMAPTLSLDSGYVSMDTTMLLRNNVHGNNNNNNNNHNTETAMGPANRPREFRLSDFHLDRVQSYVTPSDDEIIFNVRTARAYSTGSRPENNKTLRNENSNEARTRALSVGSSVQAATLQGAPPTSSTSVSSIEPNDNLVEIDFSENRRRRRLNHINNNYLSMRPTGAGHNGNSTEHLQPHTLLSDSSYTSSDAYMDMSPRSSPQTDSFQMESITRSNGRFGSGRSPPKMNGYLKSSPPNGMSYLSPTLERVPEGHLENQNEQSNNETADDDSYLTMKPGTSLSVVAVPSNLRVRRESFPVSDPNRPELSSIQPSTSQASDTPHIKKPLLLNLENRACRPRNTDTITPTRSMADIASVAGIRKMQGNSEQKTAPLATFISEAYVDMTIMSPRSEDVKRDVPRRILQRALTAPISYEGKENQETKEMTSDVEENDTRHTSKPIAIQQTKNKRLSTPSFFRRKQSAEEGTTRPKTPTFLPLGFSLTSPLASFGRRSKKAKNKDKTNNGCQNGTSSSEASVTSLDYDPNSKCAVDASSGCVRILSTEPVESRTLERVEERSESGGSAEAEIQPRVNGTDAVSDQSDVTNTPDIENGYGNRLLFTRSFSVPAGMASSMNSETNNCQKSNETITGIPTVRSAGDMVRSIMFPSDVTITASNTSLIQDDDVTYATLDLPRGEDGTRHPVEETILNASQNQITYTEIDFGNVVNFNISLQ